MEVEIESKFKGNIPTGNHYLFEAAAIVLNDCS
jgi:hypothetical protein